jgi:multimeric flavodoxin WrbA
MDEIFSKLKECHAILLASPVYFGQVTAQMKVFMDRTEPLLRYSQGKWKSLLKDKIGAALAMGGNRHGGQETTIQAMHHFFLIHDMLVVGTGSADRPGCYLGAAATTYPNRGKIKDAVIKDKLGLYAARSLGIRVAETVQRIC